MEEPTTNEVKTALKQFEKTQRVIRSNIKIPYNSQAVIRAFKLVLWINKLWTNKKIKDVLDNEPRGITEVTETKKEFRKKNYYTHAVIYLKNNEEVRYSLTKLEYRYYRFFRKVQLGF